MSRHLVCLTFDFDAMSGFISRGMTTPTPISRGEFGVVASGRLLALMKRYEIPTTWFIPGFSEIRSVSNSYAQPSSGSLA